jgi:multiple sugar transport system substrate-binding protein
VAVPTDIGPGTLLYRQDLFERAGVSEGDLTQSWDTFVDAGRRLKARTGAYLVGHARELKDIVIRTGLPSGHGLYFDSQGRAGVDSPRFARAFELARRVRQERLDARVSNWSNEWTTGLRRGALATQVTGAWLAGHLANWLAPDTRGLWRAAALPEQAAAAYGGAFFALPRRADPSRQAWAWELVQLLTLDRDMQLAAFRAHDAFPALLATHDDPFFEEPIAFLGGQRARVLWREAARRITPVAVHRHDAFADEVVNTELDRVLDRGKAIDTALADAQRLLDKHIGIGWKRGICVQEQQHSAACYSGPRIHLSGPTTGRFYNDIGKSGCATHGIVITTAIGQYQLDTTLAQRRQAAQRGLNMLCLVKHRQNNRYHRLRHVAAPTYSA